MPALLGRKKEARRDFSDDPEEYRLTLVEHLEELRDRIIKSLGIIIAATVVGWLLFPHLYGYLNTMTMTAIRHHIPDAQEVVHNATEFFMLKLKLAFVIGLVGAFPLIVLQIWAFIAPGLKPAERKPFKQLAPLSLVLFVFGAAFAWLMIPMALKFFVQFASDFPGVTLMQEAGMMVFFVMKMLLAFGIAFQLPLFVYVLGILDLLSAETMIGHWRHVVAAIFVLCMIITPTQDPITMTLMAIPLIALFMMSAFVVKRVQKKRRQEAEILEFDPQVGDDLE
jgi:sec-independent protein translocase protein TatC